MLSLGDLGRIQVTNFLASGLPSVLVALGAWKTLRSGGAGTSGPAVLGIFAVDTRPLVAPRGANPSGAGVPFVLAAVVLARACHSVAIVPTILREINETTTQELNV